ncbi:MAG TPA: Rieske (2Fe-2S) protein [Actinomycetota bacterium]|nr:Rieske (2Fe-2S) protein [Actinomycetota bacterium]
MAMAGEGWTAVLLASELPEGRSVRVRFEDEDVMLRRVGERIHAISNLCTHQGGPLYRGRVSGSGEHLAVTCPIHGSIFQLADGRVLRGPAMRPVAVFEARISGESVEVRRPADPASS